MKTSVVFSSLAFLTSLTSALPAPRPQADVTDSNCDVSAEHFYLVTAATPMCNSNSSNIPMVSATSNFRPLRQPNLFLRTIGPGYNSLPVFTLTGGALHTFASDAFGQGHYPYISSSPSDGAELQFVQGEQGDAGLSLTGGFLLGVGGVMDGWSLCPGPLEQTVIKWRGTDPGCTMTYLQAVAAPPY